VDVDCVNLLQQLVAIPSVNPMGGAVDADEPFESDLTTWLTEYFRELEVSFACFEVAPKRANVIARYDAPDSQVTILLDAHQDTVPVAGMTIDPFQPTVRDGRLYGRGSCDVKGGMAAMLWAFTQLVRQRPPQSANVVLSCTCDEEATVLGVRNLVSLWSTAEAGCDLVPHAPNMAIVAEPTELDVVVAHRGATRWKLHTRGRACHSSNPAEGISAIYRMAAVLRVLEQYAEHLGTSIPPHPLCGPATLSVGKIEGGVSVNTVPDQCSIEIDRRVIPGEDGSQVIDQVTEFLRPRLDFEVEMSAPWITGQPLPDDNNGPLARRLLERVQRAAGPHQAVGVPYGTHASRISAAGVPSVVFGPGSIRQAHTVDEWIEVEQLQTAARVYFEFCADSGNGIS